MQNITHIKADFPILKQDVNGKPLVYLDNGASSQKPQVVIDAIAQYYSEINANIHRGVHTLSQKATDAYEAARKKLQLHFNAKHEYEILFTKGTTDGINLIANGFSALLKAGDEIIVSHLEHHSNIVPWQMLCERVGAVLKVIPMNQEGELIMSAYDELLNDNTKLVAVNHISNALGTINPIKEIIDKAHAVNAAVVIDGAQATPHIKPDVQELDCDFYICSAHKMCGPTGVGVVYGKEQWLQAIPPYQGGGEMIKEVSFEKTTYADLPHKFEAGTPNIVGGIGFGVAIDYLNAIGFDAIQQQEQELLQYATSELLKIEGVNIIGCAKEKASVISFNIDGCHPYDVGTIVDKLGVAVRTGHHCAQPIMQFYNIPGTIRASFMFYNTKEDVDALIAAVKKAKMMLL
ncbi:MAG: aminotransferase class V-fold PLP-dependent enzyme [Flavobacteriaceae bacterium]